MIHKPILPRRWNKDLAYIFGLLLGDGSLPVSATKRPLGRRQRFQKRHIIHFFSNSKEFIINTFIPCFYKLFHLTPRITLQKRKSNLYCATIESKKLYTYLEKKGFTVGKKAKIARVPSSLPQKYYPELLAGLLDTDGGKKGNGFGLSTASRYLASFCIKMFEKFGLPYHSCPWRYKNHIYHQIYIGSKHMHKLLKAIPLENNEKVTFLKSHMPR